MALLGIELTVQNDDIVDIMGDLYVKTPEALTRLLTELRSHGYEVEDSRKSPWRKNKEVTVEQMEKNGWSLWFAKLPDIRRGKCDSCGSYIQTAGIRSHEHKCEVCGEVTYYEIVDGSVMRFEFLNERFRGVMFAPNLCMRVRRWDTEQGFLYFYYTFESGNALSTVTGDAAEAYLGDNKGRWETVEEDGIKLLKVRYPEPWDRNIAAIEPLDVMGHRFNYHIVKLWGGKEYREWDRLPIPETISLYEAWHWAPVRKSPTIHERILHAAGQTVDKGWFYQDGRPYFTPGHWLEMAKFVRHFTDLDADAFDRAWPRFRRDGPTGIEDLAHFCHEAPIIEDRPNMWNTINAAYKIARREPLTPREVEAAGKGEHDPAADTFMDALSGLSPLAKAINRMRKAPRN